MQKQPFMKEERKDEMVGYVESMQQKKWWNGC